MAAARKLGECGKRAPGAVKHSAARKGGEPIKKPAPGAFKLGAARKLGECGKRARGAVKLRAARKTGK